MLFVARRMQPLVRGVGRGNEEKEQAMKDFDDTKLQHDVLAELEWDPTVDASKVGVTANDGVVTLTGSVATYGEKMAAERATKRVHAVRAVANDVVVKLAGTPRTDTDIAAAALNVLKSNTNVPAGRITVGVRSGWVTLDGDVDWWHQKDAAERAIRNLAGVVGLTNELKVKTLVKPGDVRSIIEAAFKRSAEIDARRIAIAAKDGKVTLSGSVHSWAERRQAQAAAWSAPGVTAVENRIHVTP
jgi:osmotically-inducible protein OsmY